MKIGIITHYDVHNHGAVLQMYALEKVLNNLGNEAKGLTFSKNYDFLKKHAENKYNISLKSLSYYIGYLLEKGIKKTYFNYKKKQILDNFKLINKMLEEKNSKSKKLDAVFIGSDEVFSIETGLTPEFWGNNIKCKNIFSYAGCFGPTTLEFIKEKNAEEFIKKGINNLKEISVRDENSKEIIETLSDKKATLVCDPVILYGYIKEKENFNKKFNEKYVLVYSYDNNMNKDNEIINIKKFAEKNNYKIYSVGFYHKWCDKNINCNPIELLEYISNSEIILTDTFHGTVISLIMNKEFVTKVHINSNKLGFLLREYECIERITKDFSDISEITIKKIDYKKVNKTINKKRELSMDYIKSCLEKVENEK